VTVRADGSLLVSDDFGDVIYQIPPGGGEASIWYKGIEAPNGMAFSPDGSTLFVAQTFPAAGVMTSFDSRVWSLPVTGPGSDPGQVELLASLSPGAANDGMAVDENGMVYVAANVIGMIIRIDPADGSTTTIAQDLPFVASLAFGQGKFSPTSLYATQLFGGNVWEIPVGVRGVPMPAIIGE